MALSGGRDGPVLKGYHWLVDEPVDQKTVQLIGEIGKAAGMKTVAVYVDNGPALSLLRKLGIEYAQGLYIGEPTPTPAIKSLPIPISAPPRIQKP